MDGKEKMITIKVGELKRICVDKLMAAGVLEQEAVMITDILVEADQRGVHSHGVVCLPRYISLIRSGIMQKTARYRVVNHIGSVDVWDGERSNGQVLGCYAMRSAIENAEKSGIAVVAVRNSNHFGAGAYYSKMAAEKGMIGITVSTGAPTMAPWGGAERMLGNNPLAIAVPRKDHAPMILDMAMSVVAFGKITNMAKQGIPRIPEGWALDQNGEATTDVHNVYSVAPIAGYKGYGLALMIDIIAGILSGGGTGERAGDEENGPGQLYVAMDIRQFGNSQNFYQELEERIDELRSCQLAEGTKEILMPGDLECTIYEHSKEYVNLMKEIMDELEAVGKEQEG